MSSKQKSQQGRFSMSKGILLFGFVFTFYFSPLFAAPLGQKSICGPDDDRQLSNDPAVGRIIESRNSDGGCTLTMIGKSCALSAGHCTEILKYAEFNVPLSKDDGRANHPAQEDVYEIEEESVKHEYNKKSDWTVFKLKPNAITGKLAGEVQGYYPVAFKIPNKGEILKITGFGTDHKEPEKHVAQQTHTGEVSSISTFSSKMSYSVDTMPGNSGSSIILEETGEVIGVHTNGGCSSRGGDNSGYLISKEDDFKNAVLECLESDL